MKDSVYQERRRTFRANIQESSECWAPGLQERVLLSRSPGHPLGWQARFRGQCPALARTCSSHRLLLPPPCVSGDTFTPQLQPQGSDCPHLPEGAALGNQHLRLNCGIRASFLHWALGVQLCGLQGQGKANIRGNRLRKGRLPSLCSHLGVRIRPCRSWLSSWRFCY